MAEPWSIHTLVLDLDDTLIAERDYVASGFRAVGEWISVHHGIRDFGERAWRRFEAGVRSHTFNETLAECGLPSDDAMVTRLIEVYRTHEPRVELLADARELLDWAATRFDLALISDGFFHAQQRKIAATNLSAWIPTIFVTDAWGREFWKPSLRAFQEVMKSGRHPAAGYVYVADNPRKDFLAPRALGWRTVRIRREGGELCRYEATAEEAADREITDLRTLVRMLMPIT